MQTIATTGTGWEAKIYYVGKAKDWMLPLSMDKKRATSAATEITQLS